MSNQGGAAARRGRPRRVDRDRIVEAAKVLDPTTLTMRALAEEIGVDRKALHYHVDNRVSLLRMVAADTFREAFAALDFKPESDWRTAISSFAYITRDAVIATGAWANYINFETEEDLEAVRPAELTAATLVEAGLSETDAGRVVVTLALLAFASAGERLMFGVDGHPQDRVLENALQQAPRGEFALLRRLVGDRIESPGSDEQFAFEVRLVSWGVERLLDTPQR